MYIICMSTGEAGSKTSYGVCCNYGGLETSLQEEMHFIGDGSGECA